jgi:type II secretory pathway component PulF
MPLFAYKARRRSGELVDGTVEVSDRAAALTQIERLGLFPLRVDDGRIAAPAAQGDARPAGARLSLPAPVREFLARKRRPSMQETATFTLQLANLLKAGMPLAKALNSMSNLESRGIPGEVSRQLKQDVMEGRGLSDAMARQPHIFGEVYVNMVRAGEQSGALEVVLRRLADHLNRFAEVQSRFKSALIYPAVIAAVGMVIVAAFMVFMLPKFLSIFQSINLELPWATQLLVDTSNVVTRFWWLLALVAISVWIVFNRYRATAAGRRKLDQLKLSVPVVGKLNQLNLFGQFARTLATLLQNGVAVLTALRITEDVVANVIVKEAEAATRDAVTDGKTLADPLARSKVFPQLMIDLIRIGEETGDVPAALNNVADTFENELSIQLRVMTSLIEPAMIILMAVGVGFLLFSVLSAMFKMTANIGMQGGR